MNVKKSGWYKTWPKGYLQKTRILSIIKDIYFGEVFFMGFHETDRFEAVYR